MKISNSKLLFLLATLIARWRVGRDGIWQFRQPIWWTKVSLSSSWTIIPAVCLLPVFLSPPQITLVQFLLRFRSCSLGHVKRFLGVAVSAESKRYYQSRSQPVRTYRCAITSLSLFADKCLYVCSLSSHFGLIIGFMRLDQYYAWSCRSAVCEF